MKKRQRGGFGVQFAGSRGGTVGASPFREAYARVNQARTQTAKDNFLMSEAMKREAAALRTAPFEGDQAMRDELLKNTDDFLKQLADSGKYEDASIAVTRAVTDYTTKSAPIKENLNKYNAFVEQQKDDLKAGRIGHKQYQGNIALATSQYKGLSYDENGQPQFFQGIASVADPKIEEQLQKAMRDIAASSYEGVQDVMQATDPAMAQKYGVDVGTWIVKKTDGWEKVDPAQVEAVYQSIMQKQDVQSWMNRMGDIDSLDPDAYIANEKESTEARMATIDEALLTADGKTKEELLAMKQDLTQQYNSITELEGMSTDEKRAAVKSASIGFTMDRLRTQMLATYPYMKQTSKREIRLNPIFGKQMDKALRDQGAAQSNITVNQRGVEVAAPRTVSQYKDAINSNSQSADGIMAGLAIAQGNMPEITQRGADTWEFAGQTFPSREAAEATQAEMSEYWSNLSEADQQARYEQAMTYYQTAARDAAVLMSNFGSTDPSVLDSETYTEVQNRIEELNTMLQQQPSMGEAIQFTQYGRGLLATREALKAALQDFEEEHSGLEINQRSKASYPSTSYLPSMDGTLGEPLNENVAKSANNNLQNLQFYNLPPEGTANLQPGQTMSYSEVSDEMSRNDWTLDEESVSWMNVPGQGMMAVMNVLDDEGNKTRNRVAVPMQTENGMNLSVPEVNQFMGTNTYRIHSDIDMFRAATDDSTQRVYEYPISVKDSSGEISSRKINIVIPPGGGEAIAEIPDPSQPGGVYRMGIINGKTPDGLTFNQLIEDNNILLGAKGSYR
jgi:hypothetical protein